MQKSIILLEQILNDVPLTALKRQEATFHLNEIIKADQEKQKKVQELNEKFAEMKERIAEAKLKQEHKQVKNERTK